MNKLKMSLWTVALGLALNGVGVLSYFLSADKSPTALIPAFCGGLFLILAGMSFSNKLRMHTLHAALLVALLLGGFGVVRVVKMLGDLQAQEPPTALQMFAFESTALVCLAYVGIGISSFLGARRARREAAQLNRAAEKAEAAAEL